MKKYFYMGLMVFYAPAIVIEAKAESLSSDYIEKRIHKGDWTVGGNFALSYSTLGGAQVNTSMDLQKFFWDRISLGVVGRYTHTSNYDFQSIGLKGTYHFLETDTMTYFVSGDVTHSYFNSSGVLIDDFQTTEASIAIGMNYFLNSNVAIGPRLEWTENLNPDTSSALVPKSNTSLLMGFTLFF